MTNSIVPPIRMAALLAFALAAGAQNARRVGDAALKTAAAHPDEWLTYCSSPAETRDSPLQQINASNIAGLSQVWSYDVGRGGGNKSVHVAGVCLVIFDD